MSPSISLFRRQENWLLLAFFGALALQVLWTASHNMLISRRDILVDRFAQSVVVALWVMYDSVRHGIRRPFIFGVILILAWPIVAPFHLWRTRRWGAFKTVLIFLGLWFMSILPYAIQDFMDITAAK
jgi:hypothetical protein